MNCSCGRATWPVVLRLYRIFEFAMRYSRHMVWMAACLLSLLQLPAQLASKPDRTYIFSHITQAAGLMSNQVNTTLQDEDGFIWIATSEGLQRYDGTRFTTFRHSPVDPHSLPANIVVKMMLDREQNLWLEILGGHIGVFDRKNFTFREAVMRPSKVASLGQQIEKLGCDDEGKVFVHYGGTEVVTWNKITNEFTPANNTFKQLDEWKITDYAKQPGAKKYWLGILGGSFAIYNAVTRHLNYTGHNIDQEPAIDYYNKIENVLHMFFDSKGRLWFISWNVAVPLIYCYDLKANKPVVHGVSLLPYLQTYHVINGFFEQQDGTIWAYGDQVFARFLEDEKLFQFVENGFGNGQGIAYGIVNSLNEDRENNIWVGTDNRGIFHFSPSREYFTNITHTQRNSDKSGSGDLMSFIETNRGTILAGTWGDGLYEYDRDMNVLPFTIGGIPHHESVFAWSMVRTADSSAIWIASQPGLWKIDQRTWQASYYNPAVFQNKTARKIAEDKDGNLWIGFFKIGLFKWNKAKGSERFEDGLEKIKAVPDGHVGQILVDSRGYIWVTMGFEGVMVLDPHTNKKIAQFSPNSSGGKKIPEPAVASVLQYNDNVYIIATSTYLLRYNWNTDKLDTLSSPDKIPGMYASLEKDAEGFVWASTSAGLFRVNTNRFIISRFGEASGINSEQFVHLSSIRLADGRMLFGAVRQFIVFNPSNVQAKKGKPNLQLTSFKAEGRPLLVDSLQQLSRAELGYRNNSLAISFSTMLYSGGYAILYKLEGLDKEWRIADKSNEAIYSYLPPGNYTFLLRTLDEQGNETAPKTMLRICIRAPFWKTWWFYSLLALAAGGLLFWFDRERMKRKESVQHVRMQLADDLHQEVNTALGNITILSEMAKLKADKEPEKSKEFIGQIHDRSHNMLVAMDDLLWSLSPDNDSMEKVILRLREFIEAMQNRFSVTIDLAVDEKIYGLALNMKQRKDIYWLLKGGINTIVTTGGTKCKLFLTLEKPNLVYTLEFDTTHSNMQELNNLRQRKELADRLQLLGATLDVQVQKCCAVFVLQIPVVS